MGEWKGVCPKASARALLKAFVIKDRSSTHAPRAVQENYTEGRWKQQSSQHRACVCEPRGAERWGEMIAGFVEESHQRPFVSWGLLIHISVK